MYQDEKDAMREDMLKEEYHEHMMRTDVEYFCEHTVEYLYILPTIEGLKGIHLFDVVAILRQECSKYDQSLEDLLNYMQDV